MASGMSPSEKTIRRRFGSFWQAAQLAGVTGGSVEEAKP
jgi:hypothetical protein